MVSKQREKNKCSHVYIMSITTCICDITNVQKTSVEPMRVNSNINENVEIKNRHKNRKIY